MAYETITVTQTSPHVGAEVGKVDLTKPLSGQQVREIRKAITDHGVLFFRDQKISFEDHERFVRYFGEPHEHVGGDTMFLTAYKPYEELSAGMKAYLEGKTATHSGGKSFDHDPKARPAVSHPIVATHPESGRKLLFVNPNFTTKINDVPKEESDAILSFLYAHITRPHWSMRFRWYDHSIAMWDNRCTQHCAIWDYWPNVRSGYRMFLKGTERPVA